ncbi:uncharacterized protein RCO7_00689 [Rhynchosporium graminicola]|uniref:BTB domain-containing protein n=1 Tax=Rhynchosporium graminicola TaxID=2792576 RepID=A0A1E1K1Y0_9HELO|nr:uncharacterized protein RCO7_00689 [Rhynchosporium commune]
MAASFEDILNSRIFKFTVGQNIDGKSTTFTVHEEAIAALSHPLQSLVRSGLSESETGHATWEHVSKETFVRFAQFAYTGEYSVPKLVIRVAKAMEDEKSIGEEEIAEQDAEIALDDDFNHWGFSAAPVERKNKRKGKGFGFAVKDPQEPDISLMRFQEALVEPKALGGHGSDETDPPSFFEPDKIYSDAFIGHASLWVLGDYQLVDTLKALALYNLHKTLGIFQITKENMCDVIDLVRYSYADEGAGSTEGVSELRHMVCLFLAMHQRVLCQDEGFVELLAEGGQLVKDFVKYFTA